MRKLIYTRGLFAVALGVALAGSGASTGSRLNILLFTADDLGCESVGCFGGKPGDLTPNVDRFAREGIRFERAHVTSAICMPSRVVLGSGLYNHSSGAIGAGFTHCREGTPSMLDVFKVAGYRTGVLGKVSHSSPKKSDVKAWDYSFDRKELGDGRDPELYHLRTKTFLDECRKKDQSFYLMVNSHDPHRPFHNPEKTQPEWATPSKLYGAADVTVPGYLPDLPGVREEFSWYLNSIRRLDDTFKRVMDALNESGYAENTLVVFMSDNGSSFPFGKCNCYLISTRTPWIVRWPGVVKPGGVDTAHYISGIDLLPTVCDAAGVPPPEQQDGISIVPLLKGSPQAGRDRVFTQIDGKAGAGKPGKGPSPMRAVQNKRFGYIFTPWSNGEYLYSNNNQGETFKAMQRAAKTDPAVAERVKLFQRRVLEELYNLENDPNGLINLIDNPEHEKTLKTLQKTMRVHMAETEDPLLEAFDSRYNRIDREVVLQKIYGVMPKQP